MFLCDDCPAYVKEIPVVYSCNVTPMCLCNVRGETIKPVMMCPDKDKLKRVKEESRAKERATIYDYVGMCKAHPHDCSKCPLGGRKCSITEMSETELKEANDLIIDWCRKHAVKTRQERFLEHYPNAELGSGTIGICPAKVDCGFKCDSSRGPCCECKRKYWLAEVEEK